MDMWKGTWNSIESALFDAGINPATAELVRKATAQARHEGRKHAAYWAARRWLSHAFDFRRDYDTLTTYTYALCFAESLGLYGGGPSNPGAGTTRHPAFRCLGKGRRNASDGAAWTAAIAAIAAEVGAIFTVDPDDRLAIFVYKDGARIFVPVRGLLANEPEARRNFALHAARYGWDIKYPKLIVAAAVELEAAEKGVEETEPTVTQEVVTQEADDWVEAEEEE